MGLMITPMFVLRKHSRGWAGRGTMDPLNGYSGPVLGIPDLPHPGTVFTEAVNLYPVSSSRC
jgi:hypothetical protein